MQVLNILPIIFLALIAASAEANDGQSCLAQTAEFKYQERTIFLTKCLVEAGKRENVYVETLRRKFQRCDQNANNFALKEQAKGDYIYACLSKNDAGEKVASFRKRLLLHCGCGHHPDLRRQPLQLTGDVSFGRRVCLY